MKKNPLIIVFIFLLCLLFHACELASTEDITPHLDDIDVDNSVMNTETTPNNNCSVTVKSLKSHIRIIYRANANVDFVEVSESDSELKILTTDGICSIPKPYDELVLYGSVGDDVITIKPSVQIPTKIYPGDGNDVVEHQSQATSTVVALGHGVDQINGNEINTRFWIDPDDVHNASTQEIESNKLHIVHNFKNSSKVLDGRQIEDDSFYELQKNSTYLPWEFVPMDQTTLWGIEGPSAYDVQQGNFQTCGATSFWGYLGHQHSDKVRELAVELGDGTYAVETSGDQFVRVDADFLPYYYSRPGPTGHSWHVILQKAYFTSLKNPAPVTSGNRINIKPEDFDSMSAFLSEVDPYLNNDQYAVMALCIKANFDLGLSQNHIFTVLGIEDGKLIIRNPYGDVRDCFAQYPYQPNPENGRVEMDFDLLKEYIWSIAVDEVYWE